MSKKTKVIAIVAIVLSVILTVGFSFKIKAPKTVYRVYLEGKSLGIIKSKKALENYIDKKQQQIKEQYGVDKVYAPEDIDIIKEITFNEDITSVKKIYNKIEGTSPFTINGYKITVKGVETTEGHETVKTENKTIYVIDKDTFVEAIDNTVKSFIEEEDYTNFANDTQTKIEDTGKIIEKIYLENKVTIKKQNIPVDEKIYQDEVELSQYLLFGTTEKQKEYVVQAGDTIEDISFNNKMSTEEFLIANPSYTDENSLLSPGQVVNIGILNPQVNVVEQDYVVERVAKKYTTEIRYDNSQFVGYQATAQYGVDGENRVTQRVYKINGDTKSIEPLSTEVIKAAVNEVIVKGKKSYGSGYGNHVAVSGSWGWPASCSSVSSYYGWRWGSLHKGIDIAGCGEGSYIFAAQAGTVVVSQRTRGGYAGGYGTNGEYVIIDHGNGYYTEYAHMCPGCRYVYEGQVVEKGTPVGGMGRTGAATGVHLHFAIWSGYPFRGTPLNPMNFY
jgi:murein DD-endopeptidase MepM/ murein hydrolase activator NlpD